MYDFVRKFRRVNFYARGVTRDLIPYAINKRLLRRLYERIESDGLPDTIIDRVNYYNKIAVGAGLRSAMPARKVEGKLGGFSYYYYDLKQYLNYFNPDLLIHYQFGDFDGVLGEPGIVKCRPIAGDNANSILMKLNKLRNFGLSRTDDPANFRDKIDAAVWRGGRTHHPLRNALLRRHNNHPRHNIGHVAAEFESIKPKPSLTPREQLRYRYVISVEGADVATNLKWILPSQSLCLMPRPRAEAWFMEGRLEAGEHYVELRDDFADLDDKVDYYDRHEAEARAIIANANRHALSFADSASEDLISILVLQKYFERTGQLAPEPFSARVLR